MTYASLTSLIESLLLGTVYQISSNSLIIEFIQNQSR